MITTEIESVEESMDISKIENLESSGYRSDNSAAIPVGARTNRIRKLESSKSSPSILVSSKGTTANKRKLRGSSSSFAELPTSAIGFGEEDCAGGSSELIPSRRGEFACPFVE